MSESYNNYVEKINQIRYDLLQVRTLPLSIERKRNELQLCLSSIITQVNYIDDETNESKKELTKFIPYLQERIFLLDSE
jgi:hypothetical protein